MSLQRGPWRGPWRGLLPSQAPPRFAATPDHTASDFVAYDALDEVTVLGWVKDNGVQAYNEGLITSNINNIITAEAVNSSGMPWAAE